MDLIEARGKAQISREPEPTLIIGQHKYWMTLWMSGIGPGALCIYRYDTEAKLELGVLFSCLRFQCASGSGTLSSTVSIIDA